ncbi:MAG: GntR family transcriptional regulator [Alphaproteobacteria bacterium]|jgi:GntR family transcriptional regulator|nr:GntR family transcriptional regulator [Alphaproteobacteria bacterium]
MSLAQNEGLPRYQAIAAELRTEIVSGALDIGAMLPTEMELCGLYDVSRYTVRAALRQLREEGLVSMRRGSGTRVVAKAPKDTYVQSVNSLSELLRYPDTTFELSDSGTVTLAPANAERLSLPPGSSWFRISGIRRSNESGLPICWQEIFVIPEYEATARRLLTEHGPVHRIIESAHQEVIAQAQLEMSASQVSADLADRLDVEPGSAAMTITRRYTAQDERVFETTVSVHPEGRFVYSLEMTREWTAT